MTERQLDKLSPAEFEEIIRWAYRSGHWEAEGLPRMSVMELKINGSDHGLDGIGLRRRADLVDLYKLEMKQTVTGSPRAPGLHATLSGVQGGPDWARANAGKLIASDDPIAMETLENLGRRLKRYFGDRYSEELLLEAFATPARPRAADRCGTTSRSADRVDIAVARAGQGARSRQRVAGEGARTSMTDAPTRHARSTEAGCTTGLRIRTGEARRPDRGFRCQGSIGAILWPRDPPTAPEPAPAPRDHRRVL